MTAQIMHIDSCIDSCTDNNKENDYDYAQYLSDYTKDNGRRKYVCTG